MSRLRSGPGKTFLVAFAVALLTMLAILSPVSAAAQAVSGIISGNIADTQGQVIPGATLTVVNEATNDTRVTVSDGNGSFQVTNLQPGSYTVRVEMPSFRTLERKNVVLSAGERLSVGTLTLDIGSLGETVVVEARGTQVNVAETQHSGLITAKQIEQVQVLGRDVTSIMRLLPGVRYENTVDSLGMSFGTVGAERRRRAPRLEQRDRRRRRRQRSRRQQPHGAADQPGCDRRGQGAARTPTVPSTAAPAAARCRSSARAARRTTTATSTTTAATRRSTRPISSSTAPTRRSPATASTPTAPTSAARCRSSTRSSSSSTRSRRRSSAVPGRCGTGRCRPIAEMQGDFSQTLDGQGRLINIKDPLREGACNAVIGRTGMLPGQHHPRQPHQLERPRAPEHAAARQQLRPDLHAGTVQLLDAGERRQPQDEQRRPRRLEAVVERQLLLHVQGLVLRPAWQRDHRRSEQVGVLQHPLPEHGPRRQRELRQDHPVEPRARHRLRHPAADRAVLSVDRRRLGPHQPRQRRLHPRPVPPGAEPAQRHPESELQRPQLAELHVRQPPRRSGRSVADVICAPT